MCENSHPSHLIKRTLKKRVCVCVCGPCPRQTLPPVCRTPGPASTAQPRSLCIFPVQSSGGGVGGPFQRAPDCHTEASQPADPYRVTRASYQVHICSIPAWWWWGGGGQVYRWRGGGILLEPHCAAA